MSGTPTIIAPDIKRMGDALALMAGSGRDDDMEEVARVAGLSTEVAQNLLSDPGTALQVLTAQAAAEESGRFLKPVAARVTLAMVRKLEVALDAGELDIDDISGLLPKVHRVVEHRDRIDAASRDEFDKLPTVIINMVNGLMTVTTAPPAPAVLDMVDMVDGTDADVQEVEP